MRGDMGVFAVVGTALMFLAFAAMAAGIASRPDPEDAFYNQYLLLPSSVQAASDAVSACMGYAITQALDKALDHNIASVGTSDARPLFDSCLSTALNRIEGNVHTLGPQLSFTNNVVFTCTGTGGDCSTAKATGNIQYGFMIDATIAGIRVQKDFSGTLPIDKNAAVVPTGAFVGSRAIYRIVIKDRMLGRVEVNGVWPH